MKHENGEMPSATRARLPQYFRCLRAFLLENQARVTSEQIASRICLATAQVRSDLRWFDGAGQRGYGYATKALYTEIASCLGAGEGYGAVLIDTAQNGVGEIDTVTGRCGVRLLARLPEEESDEVLLQRLLEHSPELGVIGACCRDPERVARLFERCGCRGILNRSDAFLSLENITVKNCALSDEILLLCSDMKQKGMLGL